MALICGANCTPAAPRTLAQAELFIEHGGCVQQQDRGLDEVPQCEPHGTRCSFICQYTIAHTHASWHTNAQTQTHTSTHRTEYAETPQPLCNCCADCSTGPPGPTLHDHATYLQGTHRDGLGSRNSCQRARRLQPSRFCVLLVLAGGKSPCSVKCFCACIFWAARNSPRSWPRCCGTAQSTLTTRPIPRCAHAASSRQGAEPRRGSEQPPSSGYSHGASHGPVRDTRCCTEPTRVARRCVAGQDPGRGLLARSGLVKVPRRV